MEKKADNSRFVALIISWGLHPITMFLIMSAGIVYQYQLNLVKFISIFSVPLITVSLYIIIVVFVLKTADIEFTDVKKRPPLLIIATISFIISLILGRSTVPEINHVITRLVIVLIIVTSISFYWKVSFHALFFSMTVFYLAGNFSPLFLMLFSLIPSLYWSRIHLHKHELAQLIVGTIISTIIIY